MNFEKWASSIKIKYFFVFATKFYTPASQKKPLKKGEKLHHDRNVFNFNFAQDSSLKLWRCHNSIFTLKSDRDTLDVTVAMCNSISRNRWDNMGETRRKNKYYKDLSKTEGWGFDFCYSFQIGNVSIEIFEEISQI